MKMTKILTVLLLALLSFSCASTPERVVGTPEQEVERLFEVMEMETVFDNMIEQAIDAELMAAPQMEPYREVFITFMRKYMSFNSLKADLITLYTKHFTAEELRDIADFYSTPTGKKAVSTMDEIYQDASELGYKKVEENLPELTRMIIEATAAEEE